MITSDKRKRNWDDDAESEDDDGAARGPANGADAFIQTVLQEDEQAKRFQKSHKPGLKMSLACRLPAPGPVPRAASPCKPRLAIGHLAHVMLRTP
jgi:hypothetical protein